MQQGKNLPLAIALLAQATKLAKEVNIETAIAKYKEAQQIDSEVEITAMQENTFCWYGSLHGYAEQVMPTCDKAVELEYNAGHKSRGLARALTGDIQGAIEDFQAHYDKNDWDSEVQEWIEILEKGKNPFTEEVLEGLR